MVSACLNMYYFFLDESGDPGDYISRDGSVIQGSSKFFTLAGIIVNEAEKDKLENCVKRLASNHFKPEQLNPDFKLHYQELIQGKNEPYNQLARHDRRKLADDVFSTIKQAECSLLSVTINLEQHCKKYRNPANPKAYSMLIALERFQVFLEEKGCVGLVIYERFYKRESKKIMNSLAGIKERLRPLHYKKLNSIEKNIQNGDPNQEPILQLADFFAYATQKMHESNFQKADRWKSIRSKYYKINGKFFEKGYVSR